MSQTKLSAVLDEIISLVSERDSDALASSLTQILLTLANAKNTTIYSARGITRAKHAITNNQTQPENEVIPKSIVNALFKCLTTAKISTIPLQGDTELTLFPLMCSKQKPQAIITVEAENHASNHDLMLQILAIYHNLMSLIHENEHDTLTGLLNRKTFDLKINDIITNLQSHSHVHSKANDEPNVYLAIFDLDHFKRVNDTHGHLLGDEILLLFSQQMHKSFRDKDLLFRFGGEEFIGIFQCSDDDTITHILDRFREAIAQFNFPQVGQVTTSCGFTKIGACDLSSNTIGRADLSLYHAKHNGRNQICQYEQLIASSALEEEKSSSDDIELFLR